MQKSPKKQLTFFEYCITNKYSTYVLFICIIGYFLVTYSRFIFHVAKLPFIDYTSVEYSLVVGPLFVVAHTVTGVFTGTWIVGTRVQTTALYIVAKSIIVASVSLTRTFWQVGFVTILLGASTASFVPLVSNILADYFPLELRGCAMGSFKVGVFLGNGVSLGFGTWVYRNFDWRWSFIIPAMFGFGLALVFQFTVKEPSKKQLNQESNEIADTEKSGVLGTLNYWRDTPSLFLLCLSAGFASAGGSIWSDYLPQFFQTLFGKTSGKRCNFSYNPDWPLLQDCSQMYPYCVRQSCVELNQTPWHETGMPSFEFEEWISWVVIAGGTVGSILGGYVSDHYAKMYGSPSRIWVMSMMTFAAVPFSYWSLKWDYPWCFASLFFSYVFSESRMGILLTTVVELVPKNISVTSVALYMCIVSNIGNNAVMIVPGLKDVYDSISVYVFEASPKAGAPMPSQEVEPTTFTIPRIGSVGLEKVLVMCWPGAFFLSGCLFYCTYLWKTNDMDRKLMKLKFKEFLPEHLPEETSSLLESEKLKPQPIFK